MSIQDKDALVRMVHRIRSMEGTEEGIDALTVEFANSVPHPKVLSLLDDESLSDEEVVERAFAYRAIPLGPSSLK